MNNKGFALIELAIVVVFIAILVAIVIPNFINMQARAKVATVKENCYIVQLAAEDFAARNNGYYSTGPDDTTPDGECLIDLLPEGKYLINPFTQEMAEPSLWNERSLKQGPGVISYTPVIKNGRCVGYEIRGYDHHGERFITRGNNI